MSRSLYQTLNAAFMRPATAGQLSPHDQLFKSDMMSRDILVRDTKPAVLLAYLQCMDAYLLKLIKALETRKTHEAIQPFYQTEHALDGLYADPALRAAAMTDDATSGSMNCSVQAIAQPLLQRLEDRPPVARLIAHTYLRFLGDVHGGMVIYPTFKRKLNAMGKQPGYNMQYLGAIKQMGNENRKKHITSLHEAFDQVPQALHADVIKELHAEVGMMAQLFAGLHQLPQQQSSTEYKTLLLGAAVVLTVAVVAAWLVSMSSELAFEGLAAAGVTP